MTTHYLKTWPEFFETILSGEKTFELRKNDRGFRVGDWLRLKEWDPRTEIYSGRGVTRQVTYILERRDGAGCAADFGLKEGYAILALSSGQRNMTMDRETIQTLLDLLNPLHGSLDRQVYDEKLSANFDAPRDAEYAVTVTAQNERDLTQAVLILGDRLRQAAALNVQERDT